MWSLPLEKIERALQALPKIAIETGTCRGNGTRALARRFERVITIELSEELCRHARERLSGPEFSHVEFHHGNSAALLPGLLANLPADERVFFFLDAHWSGDSTVEWSRSKWKGYGIDTAHLGGAPGAQLGEPSTRPTGPEQVPLESELRAIVRHCRGPAVILVDDLKNLPAQGPGLRDQEFPGEDWSHLSRDALLEVVRPRLREVHELSDPAQWLLVLSPQK